MMTRKQLDKLETIIAKVAAIKKDIADAQARFTLELIETKLNGIHDACLRANQTAKTVDAQEEKV